MATVGDGNIQSIPQDKFNFFGQIPGINTGIVQTKVVINRHCPFFKGMYYDDVLVFNAATINNLSNEVKKHLDALPGLEGITLKTEINYRHNFIYADSITLEEGDVFDSSSINYERRELPAVVDAVAEEPPVYKEDQSWVVAKSVFTTNREYNIALDFIDGANLFFHEDNEITEESDCSNYPAWTYETKTVPKSNMTDDDFLGDDPEEFNVQQQISALDDTGRIMMPKQVTTSACGDKGVHWRLQKATPLFRGEDFFVEFHKRAAVEDLQVDEDSEWLDKRYEALDARSTRIEPHPVFLIDSPVNLGVSDQTLVQGFDASEAVGGTPSSSDDPVWYNQDTETYDLRSQAYYVIEIGQGDPDHNYVFLITQKGSIRCVRLHDGFSTLVSDFTGKFHWENNDSAPEVPTGDALIKAPWFRMEVRNYMGKLLIKFFTENGQSDSWVIKREDLEVTNESGEIEAVPKPMLIPDGHMSLWGGNQVSGFLFGPIQYKQPDPQRGLRMTLPSNVGGLGLSRQTSREVNGCYVEDSQNSFMLPATHKHLISFSSTENQVESSPNIESEDKQKKSDPFLTCDAQLIQEPGRDQDITNPMAFNRVRLRHPNGSINSLLRARKVNEQETADGMNNSFQLEVTMRAGNHRFDSGWVLPRCKPPIMTVLRFQTDVSGSDARWDQSESVDVSDHVMNFEDSWKSQDFYKIDHTGRLQFLLNPGADYSENQTEYLVSLRNKAFYVEVYGGYRDCNLQRTDQLFKLFTGVCFGGEIKYEVGQRIMDCQLYDYTKVLETQLIFNSPFFDGVPDAVAIDDMMKMAGFRGDESNAPRYLLDQIVGHGAKEHFRTQGNDGRWVEYKRYNLPSAYEILDQPKFKFDNGDDYLSAIEKITKRSSKVFFFDSHGVAHYENYRDTVMQIICGEVTVNPLFYFSTDPSTFIGQQVFSQVSVQYDVESVFNHVKIKSNTPENRPIFEDDMHWPSVNDPKAEGFIGYPKTVYQREGMFGSEQSVHTIVDYYKAFSKPPYVTKFETYGQPIRALDIIALNGQSLRVLQVDNELDPKENKWWQKLECEWLQPIDNDVNPHEGREEEDDDE